MQFLDYITIAFYFVFLLVLGFIFRGRNNSVSDYFRNGCQGTWWLVGASAFMTSFSAWTFTGAAGVAFETGWSVLIIFLGNAAGFLFNFLLTAPLFRQLRAITVPEVIRQRFGPMTQQIYAWVGIPISLLYSALHLFGLSIFCAAVFGFDIQTIIIVVGTGVLFYSTLGGSWAVMSTDFLQSLILFPLTIAIAILCLIELGGMHGMLSLIEAQGLRPEFIFLKHDLNWGSFALEFSWGWFAAIVFSSIWTYNAMGSAYRYFAVKDGSEARKAALFAMILTLIGSAVWFIPPMTARLLYAPSVLGINISKPAESAYAVAALNLLPAGMAGIMIVAMFAATMSSMDSGLNRNAAILVRDLYPVLIGRWRKRDLSDKGLMRLGQVFTLFLGLAIIGIAYYFSHSQDKGIFEIMITLGALLGVPMTTPLLLGMFIRKVPAVSALVSLLLAIITSALLFVSSRVLDVEWGFSLIFFSVLLTGVLGFVLTRPFYRYSSWRYRKRVSGFFAQMHTPIDYAREVGSESDGDQLRLLGNISLSAGGLILLLNLIPADWSDHLCITFVGAFTALVGALMVLKGRQSPKTINPTLPR